MKRKVCELLQLLNNRQKSIFNGTLKTWNIWNDWSKQKLIFLVPTQGGVQTIGLLRLQRLVNVSHQWVSSSHFKINVFVSILCILGEYLSQRLLGMCYWPCRAFLGAIIIVNPIFTLICANLVKCFFYEKKTQAAMPSFLPPTPWSW